MASLVTVGETRLRALTIQEPYASAIAYGKKPVENRTWAPPEYILGQVIAIHSGRAIHWPASPAAWIAAGVTPYTAGPRQPWLTSLPRGSVVAVARVTGFCVPRECDGGCSPWAVARQYHWHLDGVRPLPEPVPCRGMLGLWRLSDDTETAVRAQLEAT